MIARDGVGENGFIESDQPGAQLQTRANKTIFYRYFYAQAFSVLLVDGIVIIWQSSQY